MAPACGDSSSDSNGSSGGNGGTSGVHGMWSTDDWVNLPPDVKPRVDELFEELSGLLCARSRNCCSKYDLRPLADCTGISGDTLLNPVADITDSRDTTGYDLVVNEMMAKLCLDKVRALSNTCVFADEAGKDSWWEACSNVIFTTPQGEAVNDCRDDSGCTFMHGAGYRCVYHRCLPEVVVPLGASCRGTENSTSVPSCGPTGSCASDTGICEAQVGEGAGCIQYQNACFAGLGCVQGQCVAKVAELVTCEGPEGCLDDLECRRTDTNATTEICLSSRGVGEACELEAQCAGSGSCVNGICKPRAMALCGAPE